MNKKYNTITIETDRLILRKFKITDYEDMYNNWASDKDVAIPSGFPVHTNINDTKDLVKYWIDEYEKDFIFNWVIIEKKSNKAIGSITVVNKDLKSKVCELGYNIGKKWWNNGYITEALKNVVKYLFDTDLFNILTAECHDYNLGSMRVLEKNGFKKEAVLKNRVIIDKKEICLVKYSMTQNEYLTYLNNENLIKENEWLKITTTVEDYVEPNYYNKLLKKYIFNNETDLEIFESFVKRNLNSKKVLELGCGSGRVSSIIFKNFNNNIEYDLLDLSSKMIEYTKSKFSDKNANYIKSDTIDYLYDTNKKYDLVFSLWSYSHSVHQQLHKLGLDAGEKYVKNAIKKFILFNLEKGANFFIIHFDSLSDEQKILMAQWNRVYSTFKNINIQSPSLLITDEVLEELKKEGIIEYEKKHYVGSPIEYKDMDEALEIFMNFHMESYFNDSNLLSTVYDDVKNKLKKYEQKDKSVSIKPGCFIFDIKKK